MLRIPRFARTCTADVEDNMGALSSDARLRISPRTGFMLGYLDADHVRNMLIIPDIDLRVILHDVTFHDMAARFLNAARYLGKPRGGGVTLLSFKVDSNLVDLLAWLARVLLHAIISGL
jgi:hypothetical protein